jgi:hypothetical protein
MRWKNSTRRRMLALYTVLLSAMLTSAGAFAATNFATAGAGGINNGTIANGDGTGRARIEISSVQLALVKEARDLAVTLRVRCCRTTPMLTRARKSTSYFTSITLRTSLPII